MASAPDQVDAAAAAAALEKPERPRAPRPPDLRKVTDPAKREAKLAAHELAVADHKRKLQEYDDVLYPAYRAASKKASRPTDDGAKAVQRRKQNPVAVSNHAAREAARSANVRYEWEQILREYAAQCAEDAGHLRDLQLYLQVDEHWHICQRRVRRGCAEYKVEWWDPWMTTDLDVSLWVPGESLAQQQGQLDALDSRARGERQPRRPPPITGACIVPVKHVSVRALQQLRHDLWHHGYMEDAQKHTDSEAEYGDTEDEDAPEHSSMVVDPALCLQEATSGCRQCACVESSSARESQAQPRKPDVDREKLLRDWQHELECTKERAAAQLQALTRGFPFFYEDQARIRARAKQSTEIIEMNIWRLKSGRSDFLPLHPNDDQE